MANTSRVNGFRAVKSFSGAPVSSLVRRVGCADGGGDIFIGDPIVLSSGLAAPAATNGVILGVAVGFGKANSMTDIVGGAYGDPASPDGPNFYDDSVDVAADTYCYYLPADDVIFEIETDAADTLTVGEGIDFVDAGGSETTGLSGFSLNGGTATNTDCIVVEIPQLVDNDPTLIYGRYWVKFFDTVHKGA